MASRAFGALRGLDAWRKGWRLFWLGEGSVAKGGLTSEDGVSLFVISGRGVLAERSPGAWFCRGGVA